MITICKQNIAMNRRRNGKRGDDTIFKLAARRQRHAWAEYCRMFRGLVLTRGEV